MEGNFGEGVRATLRTQSGWRVTARVCPVDGRPVVFELHVDSPLADTAPEVTKAGRRQAVGIDTDVLREIRMGTLSKAAADWISNQQWLASQHDNLTALHIRASGFGPDGTRPRKPGKPGPAPTPDAEVMRFVVAWDEACKRGDRNPTAALEKIAPKGSKNPTAYANMMKRKARERGLLTSPGQGRTGGELTPKARALLAGQTPRGYGSPMPHEKDTVQNDVVVPMRLDVEYWERHGYRVVRDPKSNRDVLTIEPTTPETVRPNSASDRDPGGIRRAWLGRLVRVRRQ